MKAFGACGPLKWETATLFVIRVFGHDYSWPHPACSPCYLPGVGGRGGEFSCRRKEAGRMAGGVIFYQGLGKTGVPGPFAIHQDDPVPRPAKMWDETSFYYYHRPSVFQGRPTRGKDGPFS